MDLLGLPRGCGFNEHQTGKIINTPVNPIFRYITAVLRCLFAIMRGLPYLDVTHYQFLSFLFIYLLHISWDLYQILKFKIDFESLIC